MDFPLLPTHRLIKIKDRTLDFVFLRIRGILFTITLRQRPKGISCRLRILSFYLVIKLCLHGTPLGSCLRVIVNEKPPNLEKTTPSVLTVILIKL